MLPAVVLNTQSMKPDACPTPRTKPLRIVKPVTMELASSPLWKWNARPGLNLVPPASMIVLATTTTDENGKYWYTTVLPKPYTVPYDGPVGRLLRCQTADTDRAAIMLPAGKLEPWPKLCNLFAQGLRQCMLSQRLNGGAAEIHRAGSAAVFHIGDQWRIFIEISQQWPATGFLQQCQQRQHSNLGASPCDASRTIGSPPTPSQPSSASPSESVVAGAVAVHAAGDVADCQPAGQSEPGIGETKGGAA